MHRASPMLPVTTCGGKRARVSARRTRRPPDRASKWIMHLAYALARLGPLPLVLYVRESSEKQRAKQNLATAVRAASAELLAAGLTPVQTFAGVELSYAFADRPVLEA